MDSAQHPHWPAGVPRDIRVPATSLFYNLEVTANRYPDKPATVFYDSLLEWRELRRQAEALAGFLQSECGVGRGDRVALYMQNCPQYVVAFYAIVRADAVMVPVNPMLHEEELAHIVGDSGARVIVAAQELLPRVRPLLEDGRLAQGIVTAYADALRGSTALRIPEFVAASHLPHPGLAHWRDAVRCERTPAAHLAGADDLVVLPYTSGTTGQPKGCMLHHRNLLYAAINGALWSANAPDLVSLTAVPMFHVTGLVYGACTPVYTGASSVILPRWDRDTAAQLIRRYRVTNWTNIPTMVIDLLASPRLDQYDLSSLVRIGGGGAAMPEAVARRLQERFGLDYVEGYGLTETTAGSHSNPVTRPKRQCLGIPMIGVDSRVIDPETLRELPAGETGEIVTHGKQVFSGYWNDPDKTRAAFIELGGKRFFRTGDLGHVDGEGYFFITDRLKRMINAAGFKVWPAEVESFLYRHPAVAEACVIGSTDPYRGETVKAFVVLRPEARGATEPEQIIDWAREHMAAYKYPRVVEFIDALPKSGSGKVMWRLLQERETARAQAPGGARPDAPRQA